MNGTLQIVAVLSIFAKQNILAQTGPLIILNYSILLSSLVFYVASSIYASICWFELMLKPCKAVSTGSCLGVGCAIDFQ